MYATLDHQARRLAHRLSLVPPCMCSASPAHPSKRPSLPRQVTFRSPPTVRPQLSVTERERTYTNSTNNIEHSRTTGGSLSFGTRGSQVQILPLRPALSRF